MRYSLFDRIELTIGLTMLAVIVVLVFMASIMRFIGHPLIWSVDLAQLLFIWLCFLGANRALRQKGHIGVDLFIRKVNIRYRFIIECVISCFIIIFLITLAIKGIGLTLLNKERLFGDSGIPYAFVTIAVPIGCILMSATIIYNFIYAWKNNTSNGTLILLKQESTSLGKQN
jgi:TRAP-type C4-dicarboxylate transport system permease small subunit